VRFHFINFGEFLKIANFISLGKSGEFIAEGISYDVGILGLGVFRKCSGMDFKIFGGFQKLWDSFHWGNRGIFVHRAFFERAIWCN
jgi:hypothetical protein